MSAALKKGVFIVSGKRSPFGRYGGSLKDLKPFELAAQVAKAALAAAALPPASVHTVNVGVVNTLSGYADACNTARHTSLQSGIPQEVPALNVNRLCGSGFQAIINSAQDIATGMAEVSLAGGVENMSAVPYLVRGVRFGTALGTNYEFEDALMKSSFDTFCKFIMPQTAENLAEKYKLTREEVDQFAFNSQQRWKAAYDSGVFKSELSPVTVTIKKKQVVVEKDEHPRPETTLEGLAKLPVLFRKGGVVTAGNSSGVNDGAGALVLASEQALAEHKLRPLARLVAFSSVGVEPSVMGIGPVPAINNVLAAANLTLNDIDLIEINEAFAAQTVACLKELNLDPSKVNVNGGAIALGHPLAASGARITAHLAHELRRRGLKRAIGSACIGGGQGIALLLEAL